MALYYEHNSLTDLEALIINNQRIPIEKLINSAYKVVKYIKKLNRNTKITFNEAASKYTDKEIIRIYIGNIYIKYELIRKASIRWYIGNKFINSHYLAFNIPKRLRKSSSPEICINEKYKTTDEVYLEDSKGNLINTTDKLNTTIMLYSNEKEIDEPVEINENTYRNFKIYLYKESGSLLLKYNDLLLMKSNIKGVTIRRRLPLIYDIEDIIYAIKHPIEALKYYRENHMI